MNDKDMYIGWLQDAHSAETTLVAALENHAKDAQDFPDLQMGLQQHLEQTRRHAEMVKGCLERVGGNASTLKTGMGTIGGMAKNLMNATTADEVVKNTIDDYTSENLEIASYTSLIAAAESMGDLETATICRQILQEEEQAAALVRRQLPLVTTASLQRKAAVGR